VRDLIIGYTSGVFDILHVGHINILRNARSMCDRLIVGVTTDELLRSYKNREAVIPFEERIELVRSIRYVDVAVPQNNMDKLTMCKKLKASIMFVGDDWYNTERWNEYEKAFSAENIKIVYFPYTPNVSSTILRDKIAD
jgi:glycerol-3-phosphate cytidylyltransferase